MTPEGRIVAYFTKACRSCGWEPRKVEWSGRRGAPDWFVMVPGGMSFWAEIKAPGEKPKPHQEREIERLRASGNTVFVLDSKEAVEELMEWMNSFRS